MECPKCDGRLFPGKLGYVTVDVCPNCSGLWLDAEDVRPALEGWATGLTVAAPSGTSGAHHGPAGINYDLMMGNCPVCVPTRTMSFNILDVGSPIRMDYCSKGHGLWLDSMEIHEIRRRLAEGVTADELYARIAKAINIPPPSAT
jgi:Zn-finger nucleic acid-binding protein